MSLFLFVLASALLIPVVAVRLVFLVANRFGWIVYLANVFSEFFVKKIRWQRNSVELALALAALILFKMGGLAWAWIWAIALGLLGLEYWIRRMEGRMLSATYAPMDPLGLKSNVGQLRSLANGYPTPSSHPELTINLLGPFVERMPNYRLGTLIANRCFEIRVIVGNHTLVPTQTGVRLRLSAPEALSCKSPNEVLLDRLRPGQIHIVPLEWAVRAPGGPGRITITVEWGHLEEVIGIDYDAAISAWNLSIKEAIVRRYPGGCRSAFAWRGDMDLYDESTLQSIEGLEVTFGLAARYRIPQTIYLSTRLSLDQKSAEEWAQHYGVQRGACEIPRFVEWMRNHVDLRHECHYPFQSDKRFVVEVGNHGHLHYGTDTSGAPENGWNSRSKIGAGKYPWLGEDGSSLAEQRDNALEARRWCERLFNFTPKSWAMPDRTNDRYTAAAMEAAGCEVLSDSNVRTHHNVLFQPPPHHPTGTRAVELTKRYPGDPQHIFHVAMNHFWIHRAHRKGIPVIFMCHQHMRQFDGYACTRFNEYTLRYVLTRFHGDLHINTVYGIGKYWREVLSQKTKSVKVTFNESSVLIQNQGDLDLVDAPLDITFAGGQKMTILINLPARQERKSHLNEI